MAKNIFTSYNAGLPYQWSLDDVASQKVSADPIKEKERLEKKAEGMALNKGDDAYINNMKPMISQQSGNTYTIPLVPPDTDGIDYLSQLLTTPEQEAEYRKDNINAQKIALIGDALRQVGNVITTSKGAVPQQFSASPVVGLAAEYKADKAKRDANNLRYYSAKQQERIQAAKDALARQQMAYNLWKDKQNWDYKVSRDNANDALKKYGIEQQNARQREKMKFDAEQKELDRKNATRNAYIRSNGGSDKDNYGYQTPYGRGFKAKDFTPAQINQLYGYADANNLIPVSAIKAKMKELGLNEDAFEVKRQAVMDLLATNKDFADLVIANHDLKVNTPNNTNTNTNTTNNANANASTSSGGMASKEPVMPIPIWGKTESGKGEDRIDARGRLYNN